MLEFRNVMNAIAVKYFIIVYLINDEAKFSRVHCIALDKYQEIKTREILMVFLWRCCAAMYRSHLAR